MSFQETLQHKINTKTKPLGSLGYLEKIAFKIGQIQQTTSPTLSKPAILVFAGDHGIVNSEPVSPFPQEVTTQMVFNFLNGGAAINVFCKQHKIHLKVIDAGVNYDFGTTPNLIHAKINKGTNDFSIAPAMSIEDCKKAINKGKEIVTKQFAEGTNIIGFGEMGIGNTSSASLLMSTYTQTDISNCVGKGTGLNNDAVRVKTAILKKTQNIHQNITDPLEVLATFGGYEIAMITGAILQAKELNITILVDGFIVTSALLAAHAMDASVTDNCIFSHCSDEQGHSKMLAFLKADVILNIGLRLGEGTGAALAYPLVQSAVFFLNEMASFESANVTNKLS
ncbi:nicotinate-nucleotide--dimethylbenzimidazole phosphoribosyltransferase [Wenyingzhuangia fucanilytica]|uniref:Nicotinate-nucleotide--dimethylbenzimidazole phosphoribosyltransferase n=1 Tax=Wenyingzhuangia fucanilytica TaxID=1790137 RepID=A0A1B1Y7F9_9FLAO|nr:nicotinate-nucleotide--dimethylbenzimidazole phosphoribosyltransferase [Wenyingzhuangia fucanilytica]ANW96687.1 nicotinate-nucleotide--dimethylbenzimidazole phosphoribosyltransferase [Wenyingzhuangia fucanilytica]